MRASKTLLSVVMVFGVALSSPGWARKNSSIVTCAATGRIYTASNPDLPIPPASLTKMMTLYLVFQALCDKKLTLTQKLPVSAHASVQEPCKLWLKKGGTITVRQAILGMVTKSANDASVVLAEGLKNSETAFAAAMTSKARQLGMKNTIFKNSSGLPHAQQITTARDMAILARALYRDFPQHVKFFSVREFKYGKTVHKNHNHLLGKIKGLDGIKTGLTNASGFNLAASMVRGNHRIIAVVLGGETRHARDKKMTQLLEATYAKLTGKSDKQYMSIGGLIRAHTMPVHKPRKKVASAGKKKKKIIKASSQNYRTLNDIFRDLESSNHLSKK